MELAGEMLLVGNSGKQTIGAMLDGHPDALKGCEIKDISLKNRIDLCLLRKPRSRTRGYLKIQDGCDAFCSYCIVPYTRGRSRSLEMDRVMMQVERYRKNDVKEIIVTGIHAGYYGRDLDPPADLMTLLQKLCATFRDIRFRLSSIEPTEITEEMVAWASETENFCPHWHIPLQRGSAAILSRMNRKYDSNRFLEVTSNIRKKMPDAAIGADVMAGFPGETEKDFMATMELVKASPVTYLHVFPYSPRKGTRAADMGPRLDGKEKKRRAAAIRRAGEEKRYAFYRSQEHTTHQCLVEQLEAETGRWKGFTENYLPVLLETGERKNNLANQLVTIRVIKAKKTLECTIV
jgi:threonylcarbamoyladenosine tRNA methylthiotransferase MtaB